MTVLVVLEHRKLSDVVTVDPRAAAVGEESILLGRGEKITVSDLLKGALIQSANDAADALALSVSPSFPAFAVLMNAKAVQLGLHDTHFVRPDGLDAPGAYSSAADVTKLAREAMRIRVVRDTVRKRTATIEGGQVLHTWDDLLATVPNLLGVKTGHTGSAGWCQVAAVRGRGVTVYATILGSPSRSSSQCRSRVAPRSGAWRSSASSPRSSAAVSTLGRPALRPAAATPRRRRRPWSPSPVSAGRSSSV